MDLKSPAFLPYVVIGSVALAVLAVILYYIPGGKIKVPTIVVTGLTCLIAGTAIGVLTLYRLGYHWERETSVSRDSPFAAGGGPPNFPGGRGGPGGGGSRGGGGSGGGGTTGQGLSSKSQLATLVAKLDDVLTHKPVTVKLNGEQKAKIQDQLKGLEDKEEISQEEAKKTLDALLEIVKENKETLEAAGYRWPGEAGTGSRSPVDIPNPFKEKKDSDHLKSLREQLGRGDQLDSKIPPAAPEKYQSVRDGKDWTNPYLIIRADGIEVVAKNLPKHGKAIALKDVKKTLTGLPVEAWPYGKVVAVQEIGIRSDDDDKAIKQNRKYAKEVLEGLDIKIEWWPGG